MLKCLPIKKIILRYNGLTNYRIPPCSAEHLPPLQAVEFDGAKLWFYGIWFIIYLSSTFHRKPTVTNQNLQRSNRYSKMKQYPQGFSPAYGWVEFGVLFNECALPNCFCCFSHSFLPQLQGSWLKIIIRTIFAA